MKSLKLFLTAAIVMASATPVVAQFTNGGGGAASSNIDAPESYSILSVGYETMKNGDDLSTNGVALQYTSGTKITANQPLYLEWGIRASLGFWSDSYDFDYDDDYYGTYEYSMDAKLTTISATVPISVGYRLSLGENAAFTPYTGLHFRGNLMATLKLEDDEDDVSFNMFDKDDVGKNGQWTRFQFGWQIGGRISFNSFHIGLEYGLDFNELCKKTKTSYFQASLGFSI